THPRRRSPSARPAARDRRYALANGKSASGWVYGNDSPNTADMFGMSYLGLLASSRLRLRMIGLLQMVGWSVGRGRLVRGSGRAPRIISSGCPTPDPTSGHATHAAPW